MVNGTRRNTQRPGSNGRTNNGRYNGGNKGGGQRRSQYMSLPTIQNPKVVHSNEIKRRMDSTLAEVISSIMAIGHCIFLAFYMDCVARIKSAETHPDEITICSNATRITFQAINALFIGASVIEWCLRFYTFGKTAFQDLTFLVDTFVVWIFGVGFSIFLLLVQDSDVYTWLLSLQILRVVRILRGVKLLGQNQNFNALWLLIRGMVASLRTLLSGTILVATTVYVFAVAGTGIIGHSNKSDWKDVTALEHAERFDSLFTSIISLTRIFHADNAFDFMISIGREAPLVHIYFLAFIGIAVFLVSNLIVAVIVDNAMHITAKDEAVKANARTHAKHELMMRLFDIFQELDREGSGIITFEEFITCFQVEQMRYLLQSLDFDEKDLIELFKTLDDENSGSLNLEDFMVRMSRLTEDPTTKDYLSLQKLSHSCVDLAKIVAVHQKAVTSQEGSWYEESGKRIIKLSAEMAYIQQQLESLQPSWIDRVTNYGPPTK